MNEELTRLLRYSITPLVIIAVNRGWIPETARQDIVEAAIIVASLATQLVWSYLRDKKRQ